ncbi:hypothetical protein AHMF7605_22430 [Adhaeribacter arboris]|uniref:DNA-binding protein n=1 Tax=Adhaeribacter arboris TaxID=2072846 RepID=A0A2T2YKM6_9BACT|nr:hypothetical protein [Adhaeribacter arboris]PSR56058.1 hypothetical protein AHMF7605_22430 [Adhaeribacter arboris]
MADKKPVPQFVTPYKYAQLCGVSYTAIYGRIERGLIELSEETSMDGTVKRLIDTIKFPPTKLNDYPIEYKGRSKPKNN